MRAIILAGGKGIRLKPFTTFLPKPLVPIGNEMPVLELIIKQLSYYGFEHITLAVNHLANLIIAYFGNGERWNIKIDYSMETQPLSTIGPLTLIKDLPDNFLVMNGDIISDIDFKKFYEFHLERNKLLTVSSAFRKVKVDFGVLEFDNDGIINNFKEKPVYTNSVSMGIYCLKKDILGFVPYNQKYGFDNLIIEGLLNNRTYITKPFDGFWLDIGRPEDYDSCNDNYEDIISKVLKK